MATTWGLGDYPRMAERLMPAAYEAVELAAVTPADRVLDVACGTGNAAVVAAERGGRAVGVDSEPALLALARARAPAIEWVVGDAEELPFDNGAFDVALSLFGVMYAPDQERAAAELKRVTAPGGSIVLAAWTPGSFMPRMGAALGPYLPPPPPGSGPPSRWGDPEALTDLIGGVERAEKRSLTIEADAGLLIDTAGHVVAERERLEAEGRWDDLRRDLDKLIGDARKIELEYLLLLARR